MRKLQIKYCYNEQEANEFLKNHGEVTNMYVVSNPAQPTPICAIVHLVDFPDEVTQ